MTASDIGRVLEAAGRDGHTVLLVLDDFAGTGKQMSRQIDIVVDKLDSLDPAWPDRVLVVAGTAVALANRCNPACRRGANRSSAACE